MNDGVKEEAPEEALGAPEQGEEEEPEEEDERKTEEKRGTSRHVWVSARDQWDGDSLGEWGS